MILVWNIVPMSHCVGNNSHVSNHIRNKYSSAYDGHCVCLSVILTLLCSSAFAQILQALFFLLINMKGYTHRLILNHLGLGFDMYEVDLHETIQSYQLLVLTDILLPSEGHYPNQNLYNNKDPHVCHQMEQFYQRQWYHQQNYLNIR